MMDGSLPEFNNPKIAFSLNVSYYRRKRILDSIWSKDGEKKKKGKRKVGKTCLLNCFSLLFFFSCGVANTNKYQ